MQTLWEQRFALRTRRMTSSAIRELLKLTENPEIISFAGGLPAPEVFPVEEFVAASTRVLRQQGSSALQYGATEGYRPLLEMIAADVSRQGLQVTPENVLVTSGSQQALDLLGKVFINSGDHILVESPTYLGALQAWNAYEAEYVTTRSDEDGIVTDELESALRAAPKFLYILPNFQNPTGVTIPYARRAHLLSLADRFGAPIVEDDPYGLLRFEGESIPSLLSMDGRQRDNGSGYAGNIIYLSTYSKTLSPGIRLAYVVAPAEVIRKLVMAKQGADLHTATFNQMVAYEVSRDGFIDRHVQKIRAIYRERRDVMLDTLSEHMPPGVTWTHPEGGLFLWLTLPEGMSSVELFQKAIEQRVAFVPGESFYPYGGGENTMRLNFSNASPERINEGIARLAQAVKQELAGRPQ